MKEKLLVIYILTFFIYSFSLPNASFIEKLIDQTKNDEKYSNFSLGSYENPDKLFYEFENNWGNEYIIIIMILPIIMVVCFSINIKRIREDVIKIKKKLNEK